MQLAPERGSFRYSICLDYAFLTSAPVTVAAGVVHFHGVAGAIRVRDKSVVLTLGAPGELRWRDHVLKAAGPRSRTVAR